MKRAFSIINLIGMIFILMAIGSVANAGSGVDPLLSPLPSPPEAAPRVTLAPPPMMPAQPAPVVPQSAGHSAVAAEAPACASCMTVEVTLCDGAVVTLSVQRIEVTK